MHGIKIYMVAWVTLLFMLLDYHKCSSECEQQKRKTFHFQSLGHTKNKKHCQQRCCQMNKCQLSIYTTKQCYGLACSHPHLCKFLSEQLKSFAGHRVEKRSIDMENSTSGFEYEAEEGDYHEDDQSSADDGDGAGDFDVDLLKDTNSDEDGIKRGITDDSDETGEVGEFRSNHEYDGDSNGGDSSGSCPESKIHHTNIPKRRRGFKFHKFHGHSRSMSDCARRCCEKEECAVGFLLSNVCYGVLCGDEGNCHTKKDHLAPLKIFFSHFKEKPQQYDEESERDYLSQRHHKRKKIVAVDEAPSEEEEEDQSETEERKLMNKLEDQVPDEVEENHIMVGHPAKMKEKHSKHHSHQKEIEESKSSYHQRQHKTSKPKHTNHKHSTTRKIVANGEDSSNDYETEMKLPDPRTNHDYSGMDMQNDIKQLASENGREASGDKESIGVTLNGQDHESGSGTDSLEQTHTTTPRSHRKHQHHKGKIHSSTTQKSTTTQNKEDLMMEKIENLEKELRHGKEKANDTHALGNLLPSSHHHDDDEDSSESGSGDDLPSAHVNQKGAEKVTSIKNSKKPHQSTKNIANQTVTTRDKIVKPKVDGESEEPEKHYGHKEDIFKEFEKAKNSHGSKHKEAILKETTRIKELENELRKQGSDEEVADGSSGDGGSADDEEIISTTTPKQKKRKKKHKKKRKETTPTPIATTHVATTPPATLPTTTTTSEPKKVVAVLKYKRPSTHPTKPFQHQMPVISTTPIPKRKKTPKMKTTRRSTTKRPTTTTTTTSTTTTTTLKPTTTTPKPTTTTPKPTTTTPKRTTTTPKSTTTTIASLIPTVEVDGMGSREHKGSKNSDQRHSLDHLRYDEEKNLTDISKKNLKKPQQLHQEKMAPVQQSHRPIPKLNINVGDGDDDDYEGEDAPTSKSTSKPTANRNINKTPQLPAKTDAALPKNKNTAFSKNPQQQLSFNGTPLDQTKPKEQQDRPPLNQQQIKNKTTKRPTTTRRPTTSTTTTRRPTTTTPTEPYQEPYNGQPEVYPGYGGYQGYDGRGNPMGYPYENEGDRYMLPPPTPLYSRYHDDYNDHYKNNYGNNQETPQTPPTIDQGSWIPTMSQGYSKKPEDVGGSQRDRGAGPNVLGSSYNPYNLGYDGKTDAQPTNPANAIQQQPTKLDPISNPYLGESLTTTTQKPRAVDAQSNHQKEMSTKSSTPKDIGTFTSTTRKANQKPTPRLSDKMPLLVGAVKIDKNFTSSKHQILPSTSTHRRPDTAQPDVRQFKNQTNSMKSSVSGQSSQSKHQMKESPQDIVNRILGSGNQHHDDKQHQNRSLMTTLHMPRKPMDTIHRILGNNLDKFFKDSEERYPTKRMKNETLMNHHVDRLDDFFKKAEITHEDRKKNLTVITGVKKTKVEGKNIPLPSPPPQQQHKLEVSTQPLKPVKGCPLRKDLPHYTFLNIASVGYKYKMPRQMSFDECFNNCCQHDTCHVAYAEDKTCYLVQCKKPSNCDAVTSTTRNSRLMFLNKTFSEGYEKFCPRHNTVGIIWDKTPAKLTATQQCPKDATGEAKRVCNEHSHWQPPDFSECVSNAYAVINDKIKSLGYAHSARDMIEDLKSVTTETIDNSLIFGGDLKLATESLFKISKFLTDNKKENLDEQQLKDVAKVVSNLIDETNSNEWNNIKEIQGPKKLMQSMDMLGLYAANKHSTNDMMKPIATRSLLVSSGKVLADLKHGLRGYRFPDDSQPISGDWRRKRDLITLPKNLFRKDRPTMVSSTIYKTLGSLLPHRWKTQKYVTFTDGYVVNSNILSCAISPKASKVISPPVTITLHHLKESRFDHSKCVWWDFNSSNGSWSTDGCKVVSSNRTITTCQCSHLTHFAVLSNTNEQKVSAKEQIKEHKMAIVWLGIPLLVVCAVGVLYTCFAWSKTPRQNKVVILDKKPVLPKEEEVVITQEISERYHGSPKKNLYAVPKRVTHDAPKEDLYNASKNDSYEAPQTAIYKVPKKNLYAAPNHSNHSTNFTPSPSDLEWEHAWDCLTNSGFNSQKTRSMHQEFKKQLIKKKLLRQSQFARKKSSSESSSGSSSVDPASTNSSMCGTVQRYFRWRAQDDKEWSKHKMNYKKTKKDTKPSQKQANGVDNVAGTRSNQQFNEFSPVAISSPQSADEAFDLHFQENHYLQISFDASEAGIDSTLDSVNQFLSDIETNYYDDILENGAQARYTLYQKQRQNSRDVRINMDQSESSFNSDSISDDNGYLSNQYPSPSYTGFDEKTKTSDILPSKPKKFYREHLFTRTGFHGFQCNEFCCMTYIDQLFEPQKLQIDTDTDEGICTDTTLSISDNDYNGNDDSDEDIKVISKSSSRKTKTTKKKPSVATAHILMLQNTTVSASGCRVKKSYAKETKSSPTQRDSNIRIQQTPHMKSYIALRHQCRRNDDLSPLAKTKGLVPTIKSPTGSAGIQKSKLKRKKAFKVLNESAYLGIVRQRIVKRGKSLRRYKGEITDFDNRNKYSSDSGSSYLSSSTSHESLHRCFDVPRPIEDSFDSTDTHSQTYDW